MLVASKKRTRDPERTKERLLQAAFAEIYKSGFRGSDLDTILDKAKVTKGALYHHYENKEALGYAVVDEVLIEITKEKWIRPLEKSSDPIATLSSIILSRESEHNELHCGCPLNNLAQEMSPLDEGFRKKLASVMFAWHDAIVTALTKAQKDDQVRPDVDPHDTATFILAAYEGCMSLAKNSQDAHLLRSGKRSLVRYLDSLRVPHASKN